MIISFENEKNKRESHLSGEAVCINCKHSWQVVVPVGTFEELECPNCSTEKGIIKYGVTPEPTWVCNCGCWLFCISGKTGESLCWQCGTTQIFD